MLDEVVCGTIEDLPRPRGLGKTCVSQVLTLLAPAIAEAVLDGRQPEDLLEASNGMDGPAVCV